MARSNVPKFGNWENDDNVPYTVYFDKARKNRGGKMINPNDPQENPDMFPNMAPNPTPLPVPQTKPRTRQEEPIGRGSAVRPTSQHRVSSEDDDFRLFSNSPARNENVGPRGQRQARPTRTSKGSEQSFEKSPLHPNYQAKVMGGRGGGVSPAWEGGRSHDSSHGTNARSRLRPARGDESPEKGAAAVPRFGDWKEDDPQAAENYTHIFNKVREERNTGGPGNILGTPKNSYGSQTHSSNEPKRCCFPWF